MSGFDKSLALAYLGLASDYEPIPDVEPIQFLSKHLRQLPPHLLLHFSPITTPKQRTAIPTIRNRRLRFANDNPPELRFEAARSRWPNLWHGRERLGLEEAADEREWAQHDFLPGTTQHVGKLGDLLGGYEEEREAERVRMLRRERAVISDFIAEEEEEESSDEDTRPYVGDEESVEEARAWFERSIRERFIYGMLERFDYDRVDWDESLDVDDDREAEDRWFAESDEE